MKTETIAKAFREEGVTDPSVVADACAMVRLYFFPDLLTAAEIARLVKICGRVTPGMDDGGLCDRVAALTQRVKEGHPAQ